MRNRRGFIFPLYVVLLTLLMCGAVIGLYLNQQKDVSSSLVSPLEVLEVRDDLAVFEMRERELILESLERVEFGESGFEDDFKQRFIDGVLGDEKMREFILDNLTWEGVSMEADFNEVAFFENVLYRDIDYKSNSLILKRAKIGKGMLLVAQDRVKLNFPVDFLFEFEREYLISEVGDGFIVEEVQR